MVNYTIEDIKSLILDKYTNESEFGIDIIIKKIMKSIDIRKIFIDFPFDIELDEHTKIRFNYYGDKRYCILIRKGEKNFKFNI